MSRIRHATEIFVNQMIDTVKKLIESNTNKINVLLQRNHLPAKDNRGVVTKPSDYKSQFTFAGLKSEGVTGLPTWSHVFGVNAYSGIDGFTNVYEYAFCNGEMYIRNQYPLNEDTWGEWKQLATTSKTDISSSSLLNGWTIPLSSYDSSITKMGNQVFVKLMVKNEAPNPDTILVLPYPAIKATHLFVTTQNRKSIQCRVVNNTIIISNYQGLEANEWVNINGSYTTNS